MHPSVEQHGVRGARAREPSTESTWPDFSQLAESLPEIIPATALPGLLGNVYSAKYLSNLRHIGAGPRAYKLKRRVFHLKADVLDWLREGARPFDGAAAA